MNSAPAPTLTSGPDKPTGGTTPGVTPADERLATGFVIELARAMHEYGTPAHQLENALNGVATQLGLKAEIFTTPTSIMAGIGGIDEQRVHLLRVEPGGTNLGNLAQLFNVVTDVSSGSATVEEGLTRIRKIREQPSCWPKWLMPLAFVLSSTAVAVFLRVRIGDLAIAAVLGFVTALVAMATSGKRALMPMKEPAAAFIVTALALMADAVIQTGNGFPTSLAGLVVLLPGLMFTIALTELSTQHLSSGTARLSGAMVVFLGLGFGVALGAQLGEVIGSRLHDLVGFNGVSWLSRAPLPGWSEWLALLIAPLAFAVLLNASRRDAPRIVVACAIAYGTSRIVGARMGEEMGAFLGAFVVSAGSNLFARWAGRSAMVTQVPGLLILVPGSIGFRSVTSLFGQQVEAGVQTAFQVAVIGISLAAGILAGNIVAGPSSKLPERNDALEAFTGEIPVGHP